jgi:hypothetical protein
MGGFIFKRKAKKDRGKIEKGLEKAGSLGVLKFKYLSVIVLLLG